MMGGGGLVEAEGPVDMRLHDAALPEFDDLVAPTTDAVARRPTYGRY